MHKLVISKVKLILDSYLQVSLMFLHGSLEHLLDR